MVIPDWTARRKPPVLQFEPESHQPLPERLARPLDRLAAVIIDIFILLVPIYVLLSAPFKRYMTASFILGAEADFLLQLTCMVALGLALIIAYQALLHYFFQATFGKMLFDLRLKPMFGGEKLSLFSCVVRACIWVLEILTLGLPLLAVFSDSRRRTMHDRICDTVVVSTSKTAVNAPAPWERGLVRGFFAACLLFALMLAIVNLGNLYDKFKAENKAAAMLDREDGECDAVTRNLNPHDDNPHARLQLAMSLYAAGLADRSCLESEIELEMAEQIPVGAITYLAQAFVNADDAEVSNSYLDQVCDEASDSIECAMSKVVSRWSEEDWDAVEQLLNAAPKGSGYLEVWAVRHFMKQARYADALKFLDGMEDHRELASFSLVQRVKALYNSYQESEASVALAQALPALTKEDGDDISSWMCAQELENGCGALKSLACKSLPEKEDISEIDFGQTDEALSRVLALECAEGNSMDYLTFSDAVKDEDWQTFFRANLKRQKEDRSAAFQLYAQVIASPSTPDLLRVESIRRLSQFADHAQMAKLVDMWSDFDSREAWIKAGNFLLAHSMKRHDPETAMRVARHLMTQEALSPTSITALEEMDKDHSLRKPAAAEEDDQ